MRTSKFTKDKNQNGFALIILLLVLAIIMVLAGTYYSNRYRTAVETKKQAEDQVKQIEDQVNNQMKQFEANLNKIQQDQVENYQVE
ncbi:MAG: hypothetical protein U9M90_02710 [Patescibacteria group bacterium]|nr:hypothetical protein [Patescibacteria group bacterium]